MSARVALVCAVVVACAGVCAGQQNDTGDAVFLSEDTWTSTPSGAVRGVAGAARGGRCFHAYRGVPYAEAPTGERRFQPPVLLSRFPGGEFDARYEGPACPQPSVTPGFEPSEDCLRLNIYSPAKYSNNRLLPVVVFLHAGGFYSISGRSDVAGPAHLLARDIVLVTVNYRLGALGFLSTGDALAPGNNGFKDQVTALRWVQRNIAWFGGDPSLVTLAGYSAGSTSVALHMVSPMSKGLFHRAISMSASPYSHVPLLPHQRHLAEKQARLLGCNTSTSEEMVGCLKTKTAKEIGDSLHDMFEFGYDPMLLWNAVIEPDVGQERFLPSQPADLIKAGNFHAVPYIVSQTKDEFYWKAFSVLNNASLLHTMDTQWSRIAPLAFFLPPDDTRAASVLRERYLDEGGLRNDSRTAEGLGNLYSDAIIRFPVHRLANLMCRRSPLPVYYYQFAYVGQNSHYVDPVSKKPTHAVHHDDLIYLFNIPAIFPAIPPGSDDSRLVDKMTAIWWNFARYGDPRPRPDTPELSGLAWPAMTPNNRSYLRIGNEFSVHANLREDKLAVWDELYPFTY